MIQRRPPPLLQQSGTIDRHTMIEKRDSRHHTSSERYGVINIHILANCTGKPHECYTTIEVKSLYTHFLTLSHPNNVTGFHPTFILHTDSYMSIHITHTNIPNIRHRTRHPKHAQIVEMLTLSIFTRKTIKLKS